VSSNAFCNNVTATGFFCPQRQYGSIRISPIQYCHPYGVFLSSAPISFNKNIAYTIMPPLWGSFVVSLIPSIIKPPLRGSFVVSSNTF
jgi:hypothetical protein